MTVVDLIKPEITLMLSCPKCKWRFPVKLPKFCLATQEGNYISCAACGEDFNVHVKLLARAAQQRTGADGAGAGASTSFYYCPTCGYNRKRDGNTVYDCPECGAATFTTVEA